MDDPCFFEDDLDEEKAKRSILVTGLPEKVSPKDVVIHFQKQSNGGGEVENIDDHGDKHRSFVVITFEHPNVVESVIGLQLHIIKGSEVTVQRYPIQSRIPEMFLFVAATINLDFFGGSVSSLKEILRPLKRDLGFQYSKNYHGSYIIHGTYKQITLCRKCILDEIRNRKTTRLVTPGSASDDRAVEGAPPEERVATGTMSDDEKIKTVVFEAVPIILEFIFTVQKHAKKIQEIESKFNVKIKGIEGGSKVAIIPWDGCTETKQNGACDEYIKLYREVYDGPMASENIVLIPGNGSSYLAKDAVKQVLQIEPVAIQKMEEQDKWLFYGEETNVKSAISKVCNILKIDNPVRKPRKVKVHYVTDKKVNKDGAAYSHPTSSSFDKADENVPQKYSIDMRNPIDKDFLGDKEQSLVIKTKKGFQLTVYEGDITQDRAHAIVNTTDEFLGFDAGLSKAIVKRGGPTIEREAKAESRRRKIQPGHIIVTAPGNLKCLKIFHLITYTYSKKSKEKCKFTAKKGSLDCLKRAEKLKLQSIALPALETGMKGITLDACATAMINAVEEYMKDNDPKKGAVADIRFVHLDPKAAEVFKAELTKRYADSILKPPGRKDYGRDNDYDTSSFLSTPDKNVGASVDKKAKKKEDDVCPICLDGFHDPKSLPKCKHTFCTKCIDLAFQHRKACPTCGMTYGVQTGNMPRGTMNQYLDRYLHLPGYERYDAIRIDYYFPGGTQGPEHPNPGQYYTGTSRTAYLPDCSEGREVLGLLKKAFDARLTFTIGRSVTTGATNVVTWNDIHHKTDPYGGATGFGYPDPTYLKRVKAELAAKGIN